MQHRFLWAFTSLFACASLRAVEPDTSIGDRSASSTELVLPRSCQILPGGAPVSRPDGVRVHMLPAGRYPAAFQDDAGVYFASPSGVVVTEPAPRGTRTRPGGIYVQRQTLRGFEFLGDVNGVSTRYVLPERCDFTLGAPEPPAAG